MFKIKQDFRACRLFGQSYSQTLHSNKNLARDKRSSLLACNVSDKEKCFNTLTPDWYWVRRYDQQEGFVPSGFIYPLDAIQRQRKFLVYRSVQMYNCATVQLCNCATVQLWNCATAQLYNFKH